MAYVRYFMLDAASMLKKEVKQLDLTVFIMVSMIELFYNPEI